VIVALSLIIIVGVVVRRSHLVPVLWVFGIGESTYYGWHTNVLRVGEPVVVSRDFGEAAQNIPKGTRGIVRADPAWDEDSCEPDRLVTVEFASGDPIPVPRHILHR
jgi:hypothetical protein